MQVGTTYVCDNKECKSQVVLADPEDLKQPRTALASRGWQWKEHNGKKPDAHFCPAHKSGAEDED